MNTGLILKPRQPKDWNDGIVGREFPDINQSGQWKTPVKELQNKGTETMACASFADLNCLEMIDILYGNNRNFSDRALAKMSGTTKEGNWLATVAETVRKQGLVLETDWPFPNTPYTWDEFYSEIPLEIMVPIFLPNYGWKWVNATVEDMKANLRKGPLQVCNEYHSFVVCGYDDTGWKTFDTYGICNGHLPFDYKFEAVMLHSFDKELTPMTLPNIKDNTLVQLTEPGHPDSGAYGLKLGDKILVSDDSKDKVLATFCIRNYGLGISKKDWDAFEKKQI